MGSNKFDEDERPAEVDCSDKTVITAADLESYTLAIDDMVQTFCGSIGWTGLTVEFTLQLRPFFDLAHFCDELFVLPDPAPGTDIDDVCACRVIILLEICCRPPKWALELEVDDLGLLESSSLAVDHKL